MMIINPLTGRWIHTNKKTYKDLVKKGLIRIDEHHPQPKGLYYFPNFIQFGDQILAEIYSTNQFVGVTTNQKSRRVIQYGYLYSYTGEMPLQLTKPIPKNLSFIQQQIQSLNLDQKIPIFDQLIINEYLPGQGISPHIDHQKKFGPMIACLTLGGGTEIILTRDHYPTFHLYVEPNSLYILSGEARYLWKHSIPQRKSDLVNGTRKSRKTRVSLTFRQALI